VSVQWESAIFATMRMVLYFSFFLLTSAVSAQIYIPKFDLQGHRGARGLKPENTIPAFIVALDSGVTTLEMDLAVTKDKLLVVSHEPWMNPAICRKPDKSNIPPKDEKKFNLYRMTYEEIRGFDCGSKGNEKFPEQEKLKVSKPLLTDVIVAVEDHIKSFSQYEVDYNIEIKTSPETDNKFHPTPEAFSDLVYTIIDQYLPWERIVIQSFDFRVLKYWHEKYPDVRVAALVENKKPVSENIEELGFKPSIYSPYFTLIDKADVQYLHQQKVRIIPWTVNEEEDMKKIQLLGADGFITDYPNRANKLGYGIKRPKN
jgi:glycerophosphoryl diester phosphodiesterase